MEIEIGIAVNAKVRARAAKTVKGECRRWGFPYSVSLGFLQRNQNQTPEESLEVPEAGGEADCVTRRGWMWWRIF